jgi:hypothetical protein
MYISCMPSSSSLIPSEQNPRILLLPAWLRGCFSIPGDSPRCLLAKMHALDEGAREVQNFAKKRSIVFFKQIRKFVVCQQIRINSLTCVQ